MPATDSTDGITDALQTIEHEALEALQLVDAYRTLCDAADSDAPIPAQQVSALLGPVHEKIGRILDQFSGPGAL